MKPLCCTLAFLFLAACSRPPTNVETGLRDGVLHFGNGAEPKSIDPHVGTSVGANNIISALLEGLMAENPRTLDPVPGVAERMPEVSADGRVYTFTLRADAKWSNGDPVKPSDFEFSWHRMLNPELGARYAEFLYDIKNARRYNLGRKCDGGLWLFNTRKVEAAAHAAEWAKLSEAEGNATFASLKPPEDSEAKPACPFCKKNLAVPTWDDWKLADVGVRAHDANRTLVVTLENPNPLFLEKLNHYSYFPVHPPTIDRFDARIRKDTKWTHNAGDYVGNGPFMLRNWAINARLETERNPHYWDRANVKLNGVYFYPIDKKDTEERAARAGFLHSTQSLPAHRLDFLTRKWPTHYKAEPYLGVYFYRFNVTEPPMDDARVRRAFSISVDREQLVKYVLRGGQEPAYGLSPGMGKFEAKARYEFDPAKAKRLLEEYIAEKGDAGRKLLENVELKYNTSEDHLKIAEAIQAMWKENLGVEVALLNEEWKVFMTTVEELDYQISRMGWIGDFRDPITFLDLWVTGGGNNNTGWSSAKYDDLIARARREPDLAKRFTIYNQCEDILAAEMPVLTIYFYRKHYLLHPTVKGWHPTVLDHHPLKHVYLKATD